MAAAASGCEYTGPCELIVDPAIRVLIRHAETGAPLADSAWGVVIDGEYSDSLIVPGNNIPGHTVQRDAAYERPGTYAVFVSRSGYQNWSRTGVKVPQYRCSVRTATFDVRLTPVAAGNVLPN